MTNIDLKKARKAKNDEFYTQYTDIQKEMNAYVEYNLDVFKDKTICYVKLIIGLRVIDNV